MTEQSDSALATAPRHERAPDRRKARQVMDGARRAFLADGFDGASMNEIAAAAGVSKGTLYAYYPSKAALFEALVREDRRAQAERLAPYDYEGPAEEVLMRLGVSVMELMLEPAHVEQVRIVTGAAAKFPEIGRAFYEAGPLFGQKKLAHWLARRVEAGELAIADVDLASVQFFNLAQGALFKRMLFDGAATPTREEIVATVQSATAVFLAAYRAR
ncbi:MAG: TetR/AcrR family transcriptional regulator [Hyphomicrobiales bacterium]|nr:TetR/AcrR family transcriptional regulator [Hyphomicrobiales bacterium]